LRAEVFRQIAVHVLGPPREAIATPVVENTVRTRACERELMHNDQRSRAGVQLPDEPRDRAPDLVSTPGQLLDRRRPTEVREEVLEVQRHEHDLRTEGVEAARGVEDLLGVLIEGRRIEGRCETGPAALDVQERDERIERVGAEKRDPHWPATRLPELRSLAVGEGGGGS